MADTNITCQVGGFSSECCTVGTSPPPTAPPVDICIVDTCAVDNTCTLIGACSVDTTTCVVTDVTATDTCITVGACAVDTCVVDTTTSQDTTIIDTIPTVSQSIQEATTNSILERIFDKDPKTSKPIFNEYTSIDNLTRNTDNWAYDLKGITSIIAWNNRPSYPYQSKFLGGAAITKRHIFFNYHSRYTPGDTVYFITKDNEVISREIIGTRSPYQQDQVDGYYPARGDYMIGLLDEDLPSSIEIAPVLPSDAYNYFNSDDTTTAYFNNASKDLADLKWVSPSTQDVLLFSTNQKEHAVVQRLQYLQFRNILDPSYSSLNGGVFVTSKGGPSNSIANNWYEETIVNDSGSPVMMVLNDQLVLIGGWHTFTSGPFLGAPNVYGNVNTLISELDEQNGIDTGYSLTDADLNNF